MGKIWGLAMVYRNGDRLGRRQFRGRVFWGRPVVYATGYRRHLLREELILQKCDAYLSRWQRVVAGPAP